MMAIFRRDLRSYFFSPLGYVFVAAYCLFAGYFFYYYNLYGNSTDMRGMFGTLFTVTLFLVPILTMRLMSEERKMKTEQLLLMAPIGSGRIVCGKLLAALCVYGMALSITLVLAGVMSVFAPPEWPVVLGHFVGLLLLGAALISVGLLVSALTENQIIAAIGGFCVGFFLMLMDTVAGAVSNPFLRGVVAGVSFSSHYKSFTLGILRFADVLFFLSITALFTFFTACAFERRRQS